MFISDPFTSFARSGAARAHLAEVAMVAVAAVLTSLLLAFLIVERVAVTAVVRLAGAVRTVRVLLLTSHVTCTPRTGHTEKNKMAAQYIT